MKITLTKVLDPERKIAAIKALRSSTTTEGNTTMGLRDAKDIVDALAADPYCTRSAEIVSVAPLVGYFEFELPTPELSRDMVLDLLFDVLALSDPATANTILGLQSYETVKAALR